MPDELDRLASLYERSLITPRASFEDHYCSGLVHRARGETALPGALGRQEVNWRDAPLTAVTVFFRESAAPPQPSPPPPRTSPDPCRP